MTKVFEQRRVYSGEVSEWFKEAVLKTVEPRGSVGSNPTFSAIKQQKMERCESGRIGLPAKELYLLLVPRVRIPPSPFFYVPIAQLDRALDCGSRGRRFESSWAHRARRDARAVESGRLEICCTEFRYQGFESLSLRDFARSG